MKFKRLVLVIVLVVIFVLCYLHMNANFDVLSRYPYENENDRELIRRYLNSEEIDYIIEYDIAPAYFIEYISYPKFNIYHITEYNNTKDIIWFMNDEYIINFVEEMIDNSTYDEAKELLNYYHPDEVLYWYRNKDVYNENSSLVLNPNDYKCVVDINNTISNYKPYDLEEYDFNGKVITLRKEALEALKLMLADMSDTIDITSLEILRSYISYNDHKVLYENGQSDCDSDYPGHSEHQLGTAIDLNISEDDNIYNWLKENSEDYGFYFTIEDRIAHLRYMGID